MRLPVKVRRAVRAIKRAGELLGALDFGLASDEALVWDPCTRKWFGAWSPVLRDRSATLHARRFQALEVIWAHGFGASVLGEPIDLLALLDGEECPF